VIIDLQRRRGIELSIGVRAEETSRVFASISRSHGHAEALLLAR
jgi:hypothetical protein